MIFDSSIHRSKHLIKLYYLQEGKRKRNSNSKGEYAKVVKRDKNEMDDGAFEKIIDSKSVVR